MLPLDSSSDNSIHSIPDFSKDQWRFLAVLEAFGGPVSIEVAGALAPLLPGPLFDLLDKAIALNLITKGDKHQYAIINEIPLTVKTHLEKINTKLYLSNLIDQIYQDHLDKNIPKTGMLHFLNKADRMKEACETEIQLAHEAFENGEANQCRKHLYHVVQWLYNHREQIRLDELFIRATLELSNVSFGLGYGFLQTETCLITANITAREAGFKRHYAMTHLHLGRLYYFSDRRENALKSLSLGIKIIRELGDDDILSQSAVFIGLFYFIKGLLKDAGRHFEKAEQD